MKLAGLALLGLALAAVSGAEAALPRSVAREFQNVGIPLTAVALVVQQVGAPRPLFTLAPERPMNPASVMKLVTSFAALELLGPDYRWRTDVFLDGTLDRGVLAGNLVLKGGGDPKITVEQWRALIATLRDRGLSEVSGNLVLDRSWFAAPRHDAAHFDGEPQKPYNVGPDALLVNFKSVKFVFLPGTSGESVEIAQEPGLANVDVAVLPRAGGGACGDWQSRLRATFDDRAQRAVVSFAGHFPVTCGEREWWVALLDHPHYVQAMFETYFRAAGGHYAGGVRDGLAPAGAVPFATLHSPPLWDIVRDVNKLSNNVMAQQLFLTLATVDEPPPVSADASTRVIGRWLRARKLDLKGLVLENGSGLSRGERITAGGIVRLLQAADASSVREEFASSLAVAATDGTVERRFQNGGVAGQALLKTGSLEGVRALAGYVIDRDNRRFAIAAIVNHPNAARAQPALDRLVQWVFRDAAAWGESASR